MTDKIVKSQQTALTRAVIYRVLSRCFAYPEIELIELFCSPRVEEFSQSWQFLGLNLNMLVPLTGWLSGYNNVESALFELEKEFTGLFARPYPDVLVQPYASVYLDSERLIWGKSTAETVRYYEAVGLYLNEKFHDIPDHITAELEFAST